MNEDEVCSQLAALLAEQQGLSLPITAEHRICRDLGVCDGDFQEFMEAVWQTYELPMDGAIHLEIAESAVTVGDVAKLVVKARVA